MGKKRLICSITVKKNIKNCQKRVPAVKKWLIRFKKTVKYGQKLSNSSTGNHGQKQKKKKTFNTVKKHQNYHKQSTKVKTVKNGKKR